MTELLVISFIYVMGLHGVIQNNLCTRTGILLHAKGGYHPDTNRPSHPTYGSSILVRNIVRIEFLSSKEIELLKQEIKLFLQISQRGPFQ